MPKNKMYFKQEMINSMKQIQKFENTIKVSDKQQISPFVVV